jgi:autophagy-related protein 9
MCSFVSFVAGSFAAVLLVASLLDPDLFLHFEITPHRTVLFYLGVFGSILAVSRGMIPEENLVFDPEASLREVVRWTHYLPEGWEGKLHSQAVSFPPVEELLRSSVLLFEWYS